MIAIFYENGDPSVKKDRTEWFDCACNSYDHAIRFSLYYWNEGPELTVEAVFPQYLPWYKRCWVALKYIFKRNSAGISVYDTWIMKKEDAERLQSLLQAFTKP